MTKIQFKTLAADIVQNSSGIHAGVNVQSSWKSRRSSAEAFGIVEGNKNRITRIHSFSQHQSVEMKNE
ncbi:MAG TPA: hypothetical protein DCR24_01705 [Bacillus bacterium]|nr:hypothetical protein [Bacillus sp. (in: firmicutes)]